MARIDGVAVERGGPFVRLVYWLAKRRLGRVPEPLTVAAHHPWIFRGTVAFEYALERSRSLDPRLKSLASLKASTLIGCPF